MKKSNVNKINITMALFVHETSDFNKHQLSGTFPQSTPLSNNIACQMIVKC